MYKQVFEYLCPDSCQQLRKGKRFHQIIVCSGIETTYAILEGIFSGEQQDRNFEALFSQVMSNVITALTSNQMVAPSIWVDPKNGNNYWLTVQYPEQKIKELEDLRAIPLHGANVPLHSP